MRISKICALTGMSKDTIRFYESEGLLTQVERSANGYKNYTDTHAEQLLLIKHAKELGFTLNEIKELGALLFSNQLSFAEMSVFLKQKEQQIDAKIKQLESFKKYIQSTLVGNCGYKSHMKKLLSKV